MKMIVLIGLAILLCGCSSLTIQRQYGETGISVETMRTYGLFAKRAENVQFEKSSTDNTSKDKLTTDIQADTSEQFVTISKQLFEILLKAGAASSTGGSSTAAEAVIGGVCK